MDVKFAVYNMEWMKDLFFQDGTPKRADDPDPDVAREGRRSARLAEVVRAMDPDILCVVEGPDTVVSGARTAAGQLEAWRDLHGLDPDYQAVQGLISGGQQELCALFRRSVVRLVHMPERNAKRNPFDAPFLVDTIESLIKEHYEHYRPPLELSIRDPQTDAELGRIIVAHTKSKGIFDLVDMARFEQLSERNRRKLYAECYSIRERCDQWLDEDPDMKIIVCGDINDGFGLDFYESRFSRSAIEILLGDVWVSEKIFRHVLPRPKLNQYGWYPSSSRYKDRLTGDQFNVLIDHVIVSRGLSQRDGLVWNPFPDSAPAEVKALKSTLIEASDHFPVTATIAL